MLTLVMDVASEPLLFYLAKLSVSTLNSVTENPASWPQIFKEKNEYYHQGLRLLLLHSGKLCVFYVEEKRNSNLSIKCLKTQSNSQICFCKTFFRIGAL
jgi:hypothetical protein